MSCPKSLRAWVALIGCSMMLAAGPGQSAFAQEDAAPTTPAATEAPAEPSAPEPAADAPADQPAAPEAPASETPATETPATETPMPAAEAPATEAPAAAVSEQPAVTSGDAPAGDAPAADPAAEQPAQDAPAADKPAGAADNAAAAVEGLTVAKVLRGLLVLVVLIVPFWVGNLLANRWRMPDYGGKIGLGLASVAVSALICYYGWPPRLGPDLSGGINLIYEVKPGVKDIDTEKLIASLSRRINPGGVKEVMIRPYGARQIEIVIPKADDAEIDIVKRQISTAGALEFRITANSQDHAEIIEAARETSGHEVILNDEAVARWIDVDTNEFEPEQLGGFITRTNPRGEPEVLVVLDRYNVTGEYLATALSGMDETGRPAVHFSFTGVGSDRFGRLTTENGPNPGTGFKRSLGIVLDDMLLSAPSLNEPITGGRGQISGNFTVEEVDFLIGILNAGSLPAALNDEPISEQVTSPTLGADTVERGAWSMIISMAAVVTFILVYYRFAGVVACMALTVNLLVLLALMIMIKAAFTLPGIAGMVLTIGMAVDANVLIYERMREELARGAALRMAIRNGFSRATTTIIDSNVTTLITAVVLYWIGTDQIKGFAVTLILGILISMFTAIFLSRLVFDIAEKQRWITRLNMMQLLGNTNFDFLAKARPTIIASLIVIGVGLAATVGRGKNLLDIDFTGGSSVTVVFNQPQDISDVRADVTKAAQAVVAEVEAAYGEAEAVKAKLKGAEPTDPADVETLALAEVELPVDFTVVGVGDTDQEFKIDTSIRDFAVAQKMLKQEFGDRLVTNHLTFSPPQPAASDPASVTSKLELGEPLKYETLSVVLEDVRAATALPEFAHTLTNPEHETGSEIAQDEWTLTASLEPAQAQRLLERLAERIDAMTVFPSSSIIGGQVAADTQEQAAYALIGSVICVIAYIWFRFHHLIYGLAAVVALVHDVLVMIGALAISKYLVDYAGPIAPALMIDSFKINLPIVAALLTVMGYSLNDTIVIFDRLREIKGKSPHLTPEMINASVNQTLSRTIITSLTTLLVVVILYLVGGPGIHGFAFALVVGVVAGSYSTIFIASPVLLWLNKPSSAPAASRKTVTAGKS